MTKQYILITFLLTMLVLPSNSSAQNNIPIQTKEKSSFIPITEEDLKNATYNDINYGIITLENGKIDIGDSVGHNVDLRFYALGDLDNDGNKDAACILFSYQGGNGAAQTLCALLNDHGKPKIVASKGINTNVDSLSIVDGVIIIRTLIYEKGDPMCCPSKNENWRFVLDGKELKKKK